MTGEVHGKIHHKGHYILLNDAIKHPTEKIEKKDKVVKAALKFFKNSIKLSYILPRRTDCFKTTKETKNNKLTNIDMGKS